MKPIYFPFTYISEPVVEAMGACFKQFIVYQPSNQKVPENMRQWARSGILDIRVPVKKDEKKLDAILHDYRTWANIRQGNTMSFFKTQVDTIPFFDESSVSKIRTDIKKESQETQSPKNSDHLFNARLFLQIAQEFDMQSWEKDQRLLVCENMEQDFMKNLKGEKDSSYKGLIGNKTLKTDDPSSYMIPERIEAWSHLMHHDLAEHNYGMAGLFITSSRPTLEYLLDKATDAKELCSFDAVPARASKAREVEEWRADLMQYIDMIYKNEFSRSSDKIGEAPADPGSDKKASLTLYIVPGEAPRDFFARCMKQKPGLLNAKKNRVKFKNTLIGLVEA